VFALQAEAYLKLHQHHAADMSLANGPHFDVDQCIKFFGPVANATLLVIEAMVGLAAGRFVFLHIFFLLSPFLFFNQLLPN